MMSEAIYREARDSGNINTSMPTSMKDIVFKQLMKLIDTLKKENNAAYRVMLFTSAGTIVGDITPCAPENEMIKYTDAPEYFALDTSSIFPILEREYAGKADFYSDAYMLNVIDASVYKNGTSEEFMHLDQIIVFVDQIMGFSLIKSAPNEYVK